MQKEQTFENWLAQVDAGVQANLGVSIYDLPDMPYRAWHDAGMTVSEAADAASIDALAENGFAPDEIQSEYGVTFEEVFG